MNRSLSPVLTGVTLVYLGLVFTLLGIIGIVLLPYIAGEIGPVRLLQILKLLSGGLVLAALLSAVGKLICVAAPSDMPGKWSIFLAFPLVLLGAVITAAVYFEIAFVLKFLDQMHAAAPQVVQFSGILSVLGFTFFLIFLRSVAADIESEESVSLATQSLILGGLCVVLAVIAVSLFHGANPANAPGYGYFMLGVVVLAAVFVMRYGRLLTYLRRDLREVIEQEETDE